MPSVTPPLMPQAEKPPPRAGSGAQAAGEGTSITADCVALLGRSGMDGAAALLALAAPPEQGRTGSEVCGRRGHVEASFRAFPPPLWHQGVLAFWST